MVRLRIDLAEGFAASLFVDDEDEFDEHRVSLCYPDEIVALARRSAEEVFAAVAAGVEPFLSVGHQHLRTARAGQVPAGELTWE